jgi:hypothetical protein
MRRILGALALILFAVPAVAQTASQPGTVTLLRTGWNLNSFGIQTSAPFINPVGCPAHDGYVSTKPAPGYDTFYDAAKLAFLTDVNTVVVVVDNNACSAGRPKIIGINLSR